MDATFTRPDRTLTELSTDELEQLKHDWLQQAIESGWIEDITRICKLLGHRTDYGRRAIYYIYTDWPIRSKVSTEGSLIVELLATDAAGAEYRHLVCKHGGVSKGIFVPGEWLDRLQPARERAAALADNAAKANLLGQLSGADAYLD